MRIFSTVALCLVLVFAVTGCTGTKIAVVNPARLFQESEPGKAGMQHLQQLETAMQDQVKVAQGMLEKAPNDEALRNRFQKTFTGYQQLVNTEQQKVVTSVNELMQKSLDAFRAEKGYSVIMSTDGLLSYDGKIDVTDGVIARMNQSSVSFAPVQLEDLSKPAPVETPAEKPAAPRTENKK